MTHTTKHTPGPWVVNADGRMIEAQLPNLRNEYEHICDLRGGIKGQINLGNAHLIAAAPAMYEALVKTMKVLRSLRDSKEEWYTLVTPELLTAWDMNKAALSQAEGRDK